MEGTTFGDVPLNLELKLEVWDSPNSAGVVIDAVRCAKLALDHGLKGALIAPSSYFKKSPPVQIPDDVSRELTEQYIKDPRGTEAKLRVAAPTVVRERKPVSKAAAKPAANGSANGRPAASAKKSAPKKAARAKARAK
jgi:myo-inositol-1-phosphate synthase